MQKKRAEEIIAKSKDVVKETEASLNKLESIKDTPNHPISEDSKHALEKAQNYLNTMQTDAQEINNKLDYAKNIAVLLAEGGRQK